MKYNTNTNTGLRGPDELKRDEAAHIFVLKVRFQPGGRPHNVHVVHFIRVQVQVQERYVTLHSFRGDPW